MKQCVVDQELTLRIPPLKNFLGISHTIELRKRVNHQLEVTPSGSPYEAFESFRVVHLLLFEIVIKVGSLH